MKWRLRAGADADPSTDRGADTLETALEHVGGYNCWMWGVYFATSIPGVFNMWALSSPVYLAQSLAYRCDIPELGATEWTEGQIRNLTTGSADGNGCSAPEYDYGRLATMSFEDAYKDAQTQSVGKKNCDKFSFIDPKTSVEGEWHLVCDDAHWRPFSTSMVPVGKILGGIVFGLMSDRYGRKVSLVIACAIYVMVCPFLAIAPRFWQYVVGRVALGFAAVSCYYCAFPLLTETCNIKTRRILAITFNMSYPVGMLLLTLTAYFIRKWRLLQLTLALPTYILILYFWLLPESPRFLVARGRRRDAWYLVQRADRTLILTRHHSMLMDVAVPVRMEDQLMPWTMHLKLWFVKVGSIVSHRDLCLRQSICMFLFMVAGLVYLMLVYNAGNFVQDVYVYTAACAAAEATGYLVPIPVLRWFGRRVNSAALFLLCGLGLLVIIAIPLEYNIIILVVAMFARVLNCAVFAIIILYTAELFPTHNRNTAIAICSIMENVGAFLAPFAADLGKYYKTLPSSISGALSVIAGLIVLLLPETKDRVLPDTLEDIIELEEQGCKVTFSNCCSPN